MRIIIPFVIIFTIAHLASSTTIRGNFTYCNILDERAMINLNIDCTSRKSFGTKLKQEVFVLSKLHYVLDSYGWQCSKKRLIRYLNTSFWGFRSESVHEYVLPLTSIECQAMVESKRCDSHPMECSEDVCTYRKIPVGEYAWLKSVRVEGSNCKFHRRRVIAETNTSKLFPGSLRLCTPPDGLCVLVDSVVVWKVEDVKHLMFSSLLKSNNFTLDGNILSSSRERLLFQLTDSVVEEGFTFHRTTEGLYTYLANRTKPELLKEVKRLEDLLAKDKRDEFQPKLGDISELSLAERDYEMLELEGEFREKFRQEFTKDCSMFANFLNMLSNMDEQFHRIRDMKGRESVVYSKFGQLFLPRCHTINAFKITQNKKIYNECFKFLPVELVEEKDRRAFMFLTPQNFLVDFSPQVRCQTLKTKHMINRTHIVIRNGWLFNLVETPVLKIVDISIQNVNFSGINFNHNQQIINGYEVIKEIHGSNDQSDDNTQFHLLPEEDAKQSSSFFANILDKAKDFFSECWNWIYDKIVILSIYLLVFVLLYLAFIISKQYLKTKFLKSKISPDIALNSLI